jgi:hypothetical protein
MKHRWCDVNDELDNHANYHADFVGGVGEADLWIIRSADVLICQYRHDDMYVSYRPASTVVDHAKGVLDYATTPTLEGLSIDDPSNINKRLLWWGDDSIQTEHDQEKIARYLAIFYPDAFTEAERNEVLGKTLTEKENE